MPTANRVESEEARRRIRDRRLAGRGAHCAHLQLAGNVGREKIGRRETQRQAPGFDRCGSLHRRPRTALARRLKFREARIQSTAATTSQTTVKPTKIQTTDRGIAKFTICLPGRRSAFLHTRHRKTGRIRPKRRRAADALPADTIETSSQKQNRLARLLISRGHRADRTDRTNFVPRSFSYPYQACAGAGAWSGSAAPRRASS